MARDARKRKADPARLAAVKVLHQVLEEFAFSNESAAYHLSAPGLDARDRAFASALIFGTLANLPRIDYDLSQVSARPLDKLDPWVRTLLRAGVWQLFYSYQVTTAAACDETVRLARFLAGERTTGFVNGILRRLARGRPELEGPGREAIEAGLPADLFELLSTWYDRGTALAIGRWSLTSPDFVSIRANASRQEVFDQWATGEEAKALRLEKRAWPPPAWSVLPSGRNLTATSAYREGLFSLQSRAAMLAGCLSGARTGDRILDLCAAPGGKTGHVAELTGPGTSLTACDLSPERVALLQANLDRLGHGGVRTCVQDATVAQPAWVEAFDRVICDVPCSGLGLLQKRPEIRSRVTRESIDRLRALQAAILERAASYVAPGASLLYTTCTLNPEENEDQVQAFLASDQGRTFRLDDLADELEELLGASLPAPLSDRLPATALLLPHRDGTDGFFIARLRRVGL